MTPERKLEIVDRKTLTNDEVVLAELGYKQEFRRQFTLLETFGVAFSIIGLVPSMASVLFFAIPNGGPVAMVWGWLVASFFIMFISLALAELGSAAPTSGGLYYWTFSFSSKNTRNLLSWIVGYCNSIGLISGTASIGWALSIMIGACASIGSNLAFVPTTAQTFGIFTAFVLCQAAVASCATRVLARLQNIYIAANVLLILGLIISVAAATPKEFKNTAKFVFTDFENFNGWTNGYGFILSFLAPLWTIAAFDASLHISEEASNASIAVPYANVMSAGIAAVIGWLINLTLAFCMGTDILSILQDPIGQPMATILFNSLGQKGSLAIFSCIVVVQFMMGTSILLAASRQTFAFARDGALPFSKYLYRISPRTGTPVTAVWFCAFIGYLMGLLAFAGPTAVNALFSLGIGAQYIAYCIPVAARFIWEKENGFVKGPFHLGAFSKPVAIIALLWMSFMIIVFMFPTSPDPNEHTMNYSVVVLGGWIILSLVWYYLPFYGGVYWFKGPVANVDIVGSSVDGKGSESREGSVEKIGGGN